MAKVGRKKGFTKDEYLDAVRKAKSTVDSDVARFLGVDRSTTYRYRKANPKIEQEAIAMLTGYSTMKFGQQKRVGTDTFRTLPIIAQWIDKMEKRRVGSLTLEGRVTALANVCNHLRMHPQKLTPEICSQLVQKVNALYMDDEPLGEYEGLSYTYIRDPIRSYFMLVHGISGEFLTTLGIDAGRTKGSGSHAKERVTQEQRHIFENETLRDACVHYKKRLNYGYDVDDAYHELLGMSWWMYYTATRVKGTSGVMFNDRLHKTSEDYWEIHVVDKGKGKGIHWQKRLLDDGLTKFRIFLENSHGLTESKQDTTFKQIDKALFPFVRKDVDTERAIMRKALEDAGVTVSMPNHIWRHTFAQDFLHASDWNYELGAEIGGWKDTGTMKRHYGAMSDDAVTRGLMKAMGKEVPDVTYKLLW